ncbi:MAG: hypothetical protein IT244_02640 [Bacteroidia bacterium]|nr:hypothetical protein [Bacteroidia bacterium]
MKYLIFFITILFSCSAQKEVADYPIHDTTLIISKNFRKSKKSPGLDHIMYELPGKFKIDLSMHRKKIISYSVFFEDSMKIGRDIEIDNMIKFGGSFTVSQIIKDSTGHEFQDGYQIILNKIGNISGVYLFSKDTLEHIYYQENHKSSPCYIYLR